MAGSGWNYEIKKITIILGVSGLLASSRPSVRREKPLSFW
jgi:hypothetical protein